MIIDSVCSSYGDLFWGSFSESQWYSMYQVSVGLVQSCAEEPCSTYSAVWNLLAEQREMITGGARQPLVEAVEFDFGKFDYVSTSTVNFFHDIGYC